MLTARKGVPETGPARPYSQGHDPIGDATAEVARLTAELAAVLARNVEPRGEREPDHGGNFDPGPPGSSSSFRDDFQWRAKPDPLEAESIADGAGAGELDLERGTVPVNTMQWLKVSRRTRVWRMAQQAGAWLVTLAVGGMIVVLAAYLLTGRLPNLPSLVSDASSRIL